MSGLIGSAGSKSGVIGQTELDYEEGTWDMTVTGSSGGSFTLHADYTTHSYIKIGKLVNVRGKVQITAESSPSGLVKFTLPFVNKDLIDHGGYSAGSCYLYRTGNNAIYNPTPIAVEGVSYFYVFLNNISNNDYVGLNDSNTDHAWEMMYHLAYQTT